MQIASIDNMAEQKFAMKYAKGHAYIAINDIHKEGKWRNANGAKVTFTHWNKGEPNNAGLHGEDCTLMNWGKAGRWNDIGCNYRATSICRKTPHGDFANSSFLNSMDAFKSAQAARMRYMHRHHKFTWAMMRKAYQAKRRAMHYHHLTVKRLAAAVKHEKAHLRGFRYWNAKWAASRRSVKKSVHWMRVCCHRRKHALNMYRKAHHLRLRAAKAHHYAYLRMRRAIRIHAHRSRANRAAAHARRVAAHRRRVALKHLRHASAMHRRAINKKRAAYRAAIKAHHAVIRHMRKNHTHL